MPTRDPWVGKGAWRPPCWTPAELPGEWRAGEPTASAGAFAWCHVLAHGDQSHLVGQVCSDMWGPQVPDFHDVEEKKTLER